MQCRTHHDCNCHDRVLGVSRTALLAPLRRLPAMERSDAADKAARAADQIESLARLREASALFADGVIRSQSELRGTLATECQRLNASGSPRTAKLTQQVEQGVMLMIRQLVESASGWRRRHDEQVEGLSADLSDQFKGQRPPRRPKGKRASPVDETDVECLQRVMGQALKEKDGELRHAGLRALQEKAALQEQLSAAQRDMRRAAESEARRISELHRGMKAQAGRIGDLESRLGQTLQEPEPPAAAAGPPQLLPPPRLSPMQPLAPAPAHLAQGREFGNLSAVLPACIGQSTPVGTPAAVTTPAAAQTPGGSVKFGGVTALDTESGLWTYAAMNFSPDDTEPLPAAVPAAAAAPTLTVSRPMTVPAPAPPVQIRAAARVPTRRTGESTAVEPAAAAAPVPPPPPPAELIAPGAAELIAQTAAHVAQNGESFMKVLLSQGPEFEFLKPPPPGAKLDITAALGHAYYMNCFKYESAKMLWSTTREEAEVGQRSRGDLKGTEGMVAALSGRGRGGGSGSTNRRAKVVAPRVEEIDSSGGEEGLTGW